MPYAFFYISTAIVLLIFLAGMFIKPLKPESILIGLISIGYSLVYEIILGDQLKLYHYISPEVSTLYMVLSALFVYSLLNTLYIHFLPARRHAVWIYSFAWGAAMLLFEYASVQFKTVVFTGWKPFPWSVVTYFATYTWIYLLGSYLKTKLHSTP